MWSKLLLCYSLFLLQTSAFRPKKCASTTYLVYVFFRTCLSMCFTILFAVWNISVMTPTGQPSDDPPNPSNSPFPTSLDGFCTGFYHVRHEHDIHLKIAHQPGPIPASHRHPIGIPSASDLLLFQFLHGRHQLGLFCQGPGSFGGLQHRDTQLPATDVEDLPRLRATGVMVILWMELRTEETWKDMIVYMWFLRSCF